MGASDGNLPGFIESLLAAEATTAGENERVLVKPTKQIYIGSAKWVNNTCHGDYDGVVVCSDSIPELPAEDPDAMKKLLRFRCGISKLGSRALRRELPKLPEFVHHISQGAKAPNIFFACPTGNDLSAGVALAALCLYFDDNGNDIAWPYPKND